VRLGSITPAFFRRAIRETGALAAATTEMLASTFLARPAVPAAERATTDHRALGAPRRLAKAIAETSALPGLEAAPAPLPAAAPPPPRQTGRRPPPPPPGPPPQKTRAGRRKKSRRPPRPPRRARSRGPRPRAPPPPRRLRLRALALPRPPPRRRRRARPP